MTAVEAAQMPKNLLLADDSKTIQQAVSLTFAREDVRIVVVNDGEAALQAARQQRPDVILADVAMPRLGGYELCQKLRADAGLKDIPVLLLGGGAPVDPSRAMSVGANGLLPKPFDSGKLIEHVKQILANPRAKPSSAPPPVAKPAAAPATRPPPAGLSKPPSAPAAGTTNVMARPPGLASKPPPRPGPPGSLPPPAAKPPVAPPRPPTSSPPLARPAASAGGAKASAPAAGGVRPGIPASRPPAPAAKPTATPRPAPAVEDDEEIPLDDELADDAPVPTPLRPAAAPPTAKPSLSVVPSPGKGADGGEALLREALSKASREVIEKIAWEVVPELAETIIREELERLIKERGA